LIQGKALRQPFLDSQVANYQQKVLLSSHENMNLFNKKISCIPLINIFTGLHFFAKGNGPNNDPFRGYVLVFAIAGACILIGNLNQVDIFLLSKLLQG